MNLNIILIIGMIIIFSLLIYVIFNLYKKVILYETKFLNMNNDLVNVIKKTKEIDYKGIFEKDDEVGFIWQEITDVIYSINDILV